MQWSELYHSGQEPTDRQIKEFVNNPLWEDLTEYIQETYHVQPKLFHSSCSMDNGLWKGWNIKYKKSGRALCTLYPKQGYFNVLIPVSLKEMDEAEFIILSGDEYTQKVYSRTKLGTTGKSLPLEVTSENILNDVKNLVSLRINKR